MMQLAYRMKGYQQIVLITDCMRAGGLADGDYIKVLKRSPSPMDRQNCRWVASW